MVSYMTICQGYKTWVEFLSALWLLYENISLVVIEFSDILYGVALNILRYYGKRILALWYLSFK